MHITAGFSTSRMEPATGQRDMRKHVPRPPGVIRCAVQFPAREETGISWLTTCRSLNHCFRLSDAKQRKRPRKEGNWVWARNDGWSYQSKLRHFSFKALFLKSPSLVGRESASGPSLADPFSEQNHEAMLPSPPVQCRPSQPVGRVALKVGKAHRQRRAAMPVPAGT